MQKLIKSRIFCFILGVVISCGITSVFAYTLLAPDVGFTPTEETWKQRGGDDITNVSEALDDLYDQVKIEDYTGEFYLSGDFRANYSRYSYVDIDVRKYNRMVLNVSVVYSDSSVFYFYVQTNGSTILNISKRGTYTIDTTNYSTIRLYYYERDGYYYAKGTYTLSRY